MNDTDPLLVERYRLHAELCRVLTEPKRLMILDALRGGERSVGELAGALGVTLANASQHLAVMRAAGLVEGRRAGTTVSYRLAEPTIVEACDVIERIVQRRASPASGAPASGAPARTPVRAPARATPQPRTMVTR